MKDIGALTATISVDASELDEALRKMDQLFEKAAKAQRLGISLEGVAPISIVAGAMALSSSTGISRRGLLGLGWRKR